jgi:hypothetical protein
MKVRQGFVSNSSSSSFVLVGVDITGKMSITEAVKKLISEEELANRLSETNGYYEKYGRNLYHNIDELIEDDYCAALDHSCYSIINDEEQGAPSGSTIIGIMIADFDTYSDTQETGIADLVTVLADLKKLGITDSDIKVYCGTRLC